MTATAHVVHRMPGRTRLRIPSQKSHHEYFAVLAKALLQYPGMKSVTTNSISGSAVLLHACDLDAILEFAADRGLFAVEAQHPESDETLQRIHARIGALDGVLKERSSGVWGLGSVSFYGLLAGAAYQLYRGDFLPAGGTLAIQAFKVLVHAAETRGPPAPSRPTR